MYKSQDGKKLALSNNRTENFEDLNYYEILGISFDATQEEIKHAYRRQAMIYHPDANPNVDTNEIMKKINDAYETLSDINKRKEYDIKINKNKNNNMAYASYTKTREESESDLDDWLKEYLKARRKLNDLYQEYADIASFIIKLEKGFMRPSSQDILKREALHAEIKKTTLILLGNNKNPVNTLEFLFAELREPTNAIGFREKNFLTIDPKDKILQDLLVNEIGLTLNEFAHQESSYYTEIITYILSKYSEIAERVNKAKKMYMTYYLEPYYIQMEGLLIEILKQYKEEVEKIISSTNTSR